MANTLKKRFSQLIRRSGTESFPWAAYLTDNLTGCKFSNTYETKEQCEAWIEKSKRILLEARSN